MPGHCSGYQIEYWWQVLGLTKPPGVKHHFLNAVLQQLEDQGEAQLSASKTDPILGDPPWERVRKLTTLDTNTVLSRYLSRLNHQTMQRSQLSLGKQHLMLHVAVMCTAVLLASPLLSCTRLKVWSFHV